MPDADKLVGTDGGVVSSLTLTVLICVSAGFPAASVTS